MGHWIDAKNLAGIGRRRPHVAAADCKPERSSPRQRKWRCLRQQRAWIEPEERGGRDLQHPQIGPVVCERSHQRRKLSPCKHTAALPIERDDEAGAGSAAADVLDGGEKPVADMRQVGSLPADEDPPLDGAGGEIETQERSITHGRARPRQRQPKGIATRGHPPWVTRNTQRRRHPAGRHLLARAVRDEQHGAADRGNHGRDNDREAGTSSVHDPSRGSGIPPNSLDPRENPERSREGCATIRDVPKRVLIVDDHQPFRAVARELLENAGYIVAGEAADAAEALAAVAAHAPDAVLLDVQLPDRDGFAVAAELTAADGPAVVLISSRDADDYGRRVAACGARGFIPKSKLSAATVAALLE